jgi:hypothetical protein
VISNQSPADSRQSTVLSNPESSPAGAFGNQQDTVDRIGFIAKPAMETRYLTPRTSFGMTSFLEHAGSPTDYGVGEMGGLAPLVVVVGGGGGRGFSRGKAGTSSSGAVSGTSV